MYHPTGRVLTVLELLQSRPGLTGPELASRLETDVRTVRRYVAKLKDVGIPVEASAGRYGGYRLRPGYKLPPLIFSEHEAAAIVLGLLGNTWLEVGQSQAAVEGALSKITRVLPQAARDRVLAMSAVTFLSPAREDQRPDASLLMLLSEAIQSLQCVRLAYKSERDEITHRTVEPYGLVGRSGKWYLVGWCRLRVDYRTFRLDRILEIAPAPERFTKNDDFDFRAYAIRQLDNYPVNFHLRVTFKASMAKVRERVSPSLGTFTETPHGVLFHWPIDDLDYGARYLVARGIPFIVQEPVEFREVLRRLSREIAQRAEDAERDNSAPERRGS